MEHLFIEPIEKPSRLKLCKLAKAFRGFFRPLLLYSPNKSNVSSNKNE